MLQTMRDYLRILLLIELFQGLGVTGRYFFRKSEVPQSAFTDIDSTSIDGNNMQPVAISFDKNVRG